MSIQHGSQAGIDPWELLDVPAVFGPVADLAESCGYVAAVFGSVLKVGTGRDLDIMLKPIADREQNKGGFQSAFGGTVHRRFCNASTGRESYEVLRNGKLYHFVFGSFRKG
jgi:hypothetical protein